jgi:hypothetical protein
MVQTDEERKAKKKEYYSRPEVRAKRKEYASRPEVKARKKELKQTPEYKAKIKEYSSRPEVRAKQKEYQSSPEVRAKQKEYYSRPEVRAKQKEYYSRPEVRAKQKEYNSSPTEKARRVAYRNSSEARAKQKEYQKKNDDQRLKVLQGYSKRLSNSDIPCCNCCGLNNYLDFLAVDHVLGKKQMDSVPELVKIGYSSKLKDYFLYEWIMDNNFPDGFQILCHNCNFAKGYPRNNGKCPLENKPH